MDLSKKARIDSDKSNTIIKIRLSDMLGPLPSHPSEEDPLSSSLNEDEGELSSNSNENQSLSPPEDLSSLHSAFESFHSDHSPIEDSPSKEDVILNNQKALSEIELGFSNNEDILLEKSPLKLEAEPMEEKSEEITPLKDILLDQGLNQQGQFWKYRKPNKQKQNNVLVDYTMVRLNQNETMAISLERASGFNQQILRSRKRIKEITKGIDRQKVSQRFALDNSNSVFPSLYIPLVRYGEETGEPFYENNGCLELEKDTVSKFIELNVANEHSTFDHPSKFAMFYPRRFPRRRRRRRNAGKYNINNEQTEEVVT